MFIYLVVQTTAILFFVGGSSGTQEDMDRRNIADDIRRMRTLQDIKYYRDMFRSNRDDK